MYAPQRSTPLQRKYEENDLSMFPDENMEPFLDILEHPKARGFRFRYSCEGPSHGGIPGGSSDKNKKTYPAVQIKNYSGYARIVVQLVTNEENPRLHPHSLVGKQCQNGICTVQCGPKDMTATFPNLGIQHVTKKNVAKILEERYMAAEMQLSSLNDVSLSAEVQSVIKDEDKKRIQAKAVAEAKSIDLSVVRLMFIAYLPDSNGSFTLMLKPVISDAIFDSKSPNAATLKICRMDKTFGAASGMDEIYLLCDKVQKDDIQVRFFEEDDMGEELWEAYGDFSPTDVHRQFAIVFRTPRYKDVMIDRPAPVQVQLRRRSDGEVSEARPFTYMPVQDDPEQIHRKRRKVSAHFTDHISGNRTNGGTAQGGLIGSHLASGNFTFQSNGSNNGGMKQSRYGPPPKAKNPQAGPLDPTMLLRLNNLKQEPRSPPMNVLQNVNQNSPAQSMNSPHMSPQNQMVSSPMAAQRSPYSDSGVSDVSSSPPQRLIPGTQIPAPRPINSSPVAPSFVPLETVQYQQQQQVVQAQQVAYQQQSASLGSQFVYMDASSQMMPVGSSSNALYYTSADVAANQVTANGQIQDDEDLLQQIINVVTESGLMDQHTNTVTNTGSTMMSHSDPSAVMEILSASMWRGVTPVDMIASDSTAEDQTKNGVDEEDFSHGMADKKTEIPKVKVEAVPDDVASDSCTIAPQEVEIPVNHEPTKPKEGLTTKKPAQEEQKKPQAAETKKGKKDVGSNKTDDMKLNHDSDFIKNMDSKSLQELLMNITIRTASALQDFAATGDVRILLATQRQLTDVQDVDGDTPVHLAVIHGQDEVLLSLIHLVQTIPGSKSIINRANDRMLTPLHIAIHIENPSAVKWLLSVGADPLLGDSNGNTAIHLACITGQADILELLLREMKRDIETHNYSGLTPLHLLAPKMTESARQCINLLIKHGHNVDACEMKRGRTALHIAAEENNLVVAGYLISECNADLECRTYDGLTPLHIAVARDSQEIGTLLLACGADPVAQFSEEIESTPLNLCVSKKMRDILAGESAFDELGFTRDSYSSYIDDVDDVCTLDPLVRLKLCRLLDPRASGKDWYALASRLSMESLVGIIENEDRSPTETLLENYSCIQGSIAGLKSALAQIGRQDAADLLTDRKTDMCSRPKHDMDMDRIDSAIGSMTLSERSISIPGDIICD